MAKHRVPVTLELNDNFTGRLALVKQAAHDTHVAWTLMNATWEPHDWSDF